ncbi:hypothetical protein C5167_012909 [Papaver somniferum]|uniref:Uncharacterized protein n=1 Tax=Papaver somniferum TaxID=3469 RepID=A0A4Y7IYV0_PAPSO|nr:hypothetical protein C5167_012909 [Papaver somniferum]
MRVAAGLHGLTSRQSTSTTTATATSTFSRESFDNEIAVSSLGSIVRILHVACEVKPVRPCVGELCVYEIELQSLTRLRKLVGKVLDSSKQVSTSHYKDRDFSVLSFTLKLSLLYRVKATAALEIESVYQQYCQQYVRTLDKGEEADR